MEGTSSGQQSPTNIVNNTFSVQNDATNQQHISVQDMTNSSSTSYNIERREMLALAERQRIHSMTQEQRQSYLARRRSNYRRRRMELNSSNSTSNHNSDQQLNWRLAQRNRRRSMNEEARNIELARRCATYQIRRQNNESSSIPDASALPNNDFFAPTTRIEESSHNIDVDVTTTVRQTCRSEPISYQILTSNFEHGCTSGRQPPTNYAHQGILLNPNK